VTTLEFILELTVYIDFIESCVIMFLYFGICLLT